MRKTMPAGDQRTPGDSAVRARTAVVGGKRLVPAPDPIARDYLLLALRLERHVPGLVDGFFGLADLADLVGSDDLRPPALLREDATAIRERVLAEVAEPARRRWLAAQLVALEAHARGLAGDPLPYVAHVTACFDFEPTRTDDAVFAAAAADLEALLPGDGDLADRIAAWDARFTIPADRLRGTIDALLPGFRARAEELFGLPAGEDLAVSLVRDQPWSGYNWFDGGLRSRVEINTDLPTRAADLLALLAHEAYPGHHTEHVWKESQLVEAEGRLEASVLLINAPECLLSEGLADLGRRFAVPPGDEMDLLVDVYRLAGLPVAADTPAARHAAARQVEISRALAAVRGVAGNAALLLHADGAPRDEVLAYLRRNLLTTPERAAKRLEFIEHPLWRTYVFVYFEGERLLRRGLDAVPAAEQAARFRRLLVEELTPSMILEETAVAG